MRLKKIISGGQTGVDRAALEVAIKHNLPHGGWCPPGREAEDGPIPDQFNLTEAPKERSDIAPDIPRSLRTEMNVRYSDGTFILTPQKTFDDPGTNWTLRIAALSRKPILVLHPEDKDSTFKALAWIKLHKIEILNVAGPAESNLPGIHKIAYSFLDEFLTSLKKIE